MKRTFFLSFMLTIILSMYSFSQPPCQQSSRNYYFTLPVVATYPPINSGMPLDVLVSYIVADSVCKTANINEVRDFFERQDYDNFSDSLKFMMKHLYRMVDHDPLSAYIYYVQRPYLGYLTPNLLAQRYSRVLREKSDSALTYNLLLQSFYILHVNVEDTVLVDNTEQYYSNALTISLVTVLDTLKGNVIANISTPGGNGIEKRFEDKSQSGIGASMLFQYSDGWLRGGNLPMTDANGDSWIKPGHEYILFLDLRTLCSDENGQYVSVMPLVYESSTSAGMYPIVNGNVIDDSNDWGLGEIVPLQNFIDRIQAHIDYIKNYKE